MRFIGVLGIIVLLGLAWALSYHKRDVKLRIVFWGLGLQFLFAVIILREDFWSFVGMSVLAGLVSVYLLRMDRATPDRPPRKVITLLAAAAAVGLLLALAGPPVAAGAAGICLVMLLLNSKFKVAPRAQALLGVVIVVSVAAWLIASDIYGQIIFIAFSEKVAAFLSLSDYGARFLFGNLADPQYFFPGGASSWPGFGFQFAFKVLPTILFFGGFMAVLYYLGIMQKVIEALARFMRWTVGTSGAETLSCTANIFVGQTEAPLLIKPFLRDMTRSELLTIMVGGFATIAGGVLAAYIAMGIPAGHLIAASVMSAPAALLVGKIIYPELEHSVTAGDVEMPEIKSGSNVIEAASNGITDGLKLAVNVGAMLVGFIALIAVIDVAFNWVDSLVDGLLLHGEWVTYTSGGMSPVVGEYLGVIPGSLQTLFGTLLRPLAWLMGVPWVDADKVGNLLGIKLSLNELVAYGVLGSYSAEGVISEKAVVISTYALCGFANFSSIGIQIGGIAAVAPERRTDLAQLGLKAMLGGAIASWLTATIAGMLL
ncbi:MAG: nucleoside transporter C-terminal domain-containing protein [Acidobacteriota bacterium]|nr:nucleoside transporter C-terminal domain-containing protein [Acidobacteriota bacterium]